MEGTITNNNMKFAGKFRIENEGGTVTADNSDNTKGSLTVQDADSVVIYVALATNYKNEFPDYRQADADYAINSVTERIENASAKKYDALYEAHLADYQELFSRVELDLGGTYNADEETDQLLSSWNKNSPNGTQNHYLEELYFQYGRYMMIASSRSDTLPSNLQGIWNDRAFADWQSDYHTNINLQMNYWPAYSTNLAEIGESLNSYVESLAEPGQLTAQKLFGTTGDAWMVNCSANALGFTGNINSNASLAVTANAFILQNVYDYYQYTQDKETLQKLSRCKEQASQFIADAALAVVVMADPLGSDVWIEDASIASIYLQLQAEDLGLGSCWVQVRERFAAPGITSEEYVRDVLDIPLQLQVLSIIAIGHKGMERKPFNEEHLQWEKIHLNKYGGNNGECGEGE